MTFWKGLHIVVTGGAGMIGTPLVRTLLERGAIVRVLDDFSRGTTEVPGAGYMVGDAGDYDTCEEALQGADGLLNLAAHVAGVAYNQSHHAEMFTKNILLQATPLVAAERLGVRAVQVSTVCVYDPEHACPADPANGLVGRPHKANWGYSMAKRYGEQLCLGKSDMVRVRLTNAYGPLDYYGERAHVIPALIERAHKEGHKMTLLGTGHEQREFIYSEDVAEGIMAAFKHGRGGARAYNLGTNGQTVTDMSSLARMIINMVTGKVAELSFDTTRGGGDRERCTDSHLSRTELGWEFRTKLEDGIGATIADYRRRFLQ